MSGAAPDIRVVLFDLDDTLMAHSRAVDLAIALAQRAAGGQFATDEKAAVQARWRGDARTADTKLSIDC